MGYYPIYLDYQYFYLRQKPSLKILKEKDSKINKIINSLGRARWGDSGALT